MKKRKEKYDILENLWVVKKTRVRFNETDPLGIVWHGNYIMYFEDGREEFGRQHGISYLDVQRNGYVTPITKFVCEHKISIKYGEVIEIHTNIVKTEAAKMIYIFRIYNAENKLACVGESHQVFVNQKTNELELYAPKFFEDWKKSVHLI